MVDGCGLVPYPVRIRYQTTTNHNMANCVHWHCAVPPTTSLRWRHNGRDGVSNHQPYDCLFNSLFRRRSKKTSKLRVAGHCAGNSPVTGEFPTQMASNAENVSIGWRHYADYHIHVYVIVSGSTTLPPSCPVPVKQLWTNQSRKSI